MTEIEVELSTFLVLAELKLEMSSPDKPEPAKISPVPALIPSFALKNQTSSLFSAYLKIGLVKSQALRLIYC